MLVADLAGLTSLTGGAAGVMLTAVHRPMRRLDLAHVLDAVAAAAISTQDVTGPAHSWSR